MLLTATAQHLPMNGCSYLVHSPQARPHAPPGEHLVLVGDCKALGDWDVANGLRLGWCSGHMHTATFMLPSDWQTFKAKLVMLHGVGEGQAASAPTHVTWEQGFDRSVVLQAPAASEFDELVGKGKGAKGGAGKGAKAAAKPVAHDYIVICHWQHTEATTVLAREVPGEVLVSGAAAVATGGQGVPKERAWMAMKCLPGGSFGCRREMWEGHICCHWRRRRQGRAGGVLWDRQTHRLSRLHSMGAWAIHISPRVLVRRDQSVLPLGAQVLEQQLNKALAELRSSREAAASSQAKLQAMARDLADSEKRAQQSVEQLTELQVG